MITSILFTRKTINSCILPKVNSLIVLLPSLDSSLIKGQIYPINLAISLFINAGLFSIELGFLEKGSIVILTNVQLTNQYLCSTAKSAEINEKRSSKGIYIL
jgi:hypothetical protein